MKVPVDTMLALRQIKDAIQSVTLNNSVIMNLNQIINQNYAPISCMIWNVQGAGSKAFVAMLRETVRVNQP